MVVLLILVVGGILLVTGLTFAVLRAWGRGVEELEDELHQPDARTLTYAVPPGRDPAQLLTALSLAGYRAIEDGPSRLLVACPREDDPGKVQALLDRA
jgi:hypothetical protein